MSHENMAANFHFVKRIKNFSVKPKTTSFAKLLNKRIPTDS